MPSYRRYRLFPIGAAVAALALTLSACGGGSAASATDKAAVGAPVAGGTLRFAVLDAPQHLDPQEASSYPEAIIADNITDRLTWQDPSTGKLYPWLATSWSANAALTQFTFHLRKGVTFSDGTPFDAQVVKDNFDQKAFGSQKLGLEADTSHWAGYTGTKVVDADTVTVGFSHPNSGFLQFSAFTGDNEPGFVAESTLKESAEQRAKDVRTIIGTGPFVLKSFTYQQSVVLSRRAGYTWAPAPIAHSANGGAAYLAAVKIETIPEASVRTGALESGDLDASLDVQPTDEKALKAAGFQILAQGVPGKVIAFDLNTSLFPTDDIAVRKALTIGWDRSSLSKSVLTGSYKVATSVLGSKVPGYADYGSTALKYDPTAAEKLLQDDGWVPGPGGIRVKDGKKLTVRILGISNLVVNQPAYELIQAELKKIGIDLELSVLPIADFTVQFAKAKTAYNGVAGNTSRDDASVLWQTYSPSVGNASFVDAHSAEGTALTAALQKIQDTLDPTARAAATKAAQDLILTDDALTDPVYEPTQVVAASGQTHGIGFDAQSRNDFYNAWLGK
jgi:peptide/nickel transport system substrate-binding protein